MKIMKIKFFQKNHMQALKKLQALKNLEAIILEKFDANGAVIVSDGEDDEMVIPVIQNVIPVVSVQRVVMQVSRTIEHSYAVFGKFL